MTAMQWGAEDLREDEETAPVVVADLQGPCALQMADGTIIIDREHASTQREADVSAAWVRGFLHRKNGSDTA